MSIVTFDAKRTQVAQSAFDFSRYFDSAMGRVEVLGAPPRRPILQPPDGMSTAGGKKARQAIALASADGSASAMTVGWVDIAERKAMLRTFGCVQGLHQQRFKGRPIGIDQASFTAFFDYARSFLASCGMQLAIENEAPPPAISSRPPPAAPETSIGWTILAVAFAAFAVGFLVGGLLVYYRFVGRPF